jgi:charged multivesicular body protein 4
MSWLFGKKRDGGMQPPTHKEQARQGVTAKAATGVMAVKEKMDVLEKKQKHLERQMVTCMADAKKKMAAGDKRGAMMCMKKKKM